MLSSLILSAALASSGHAFPPLPAPPAADVAAVMAVCHDYLEGQLAGDVARVARVLHPDLAKRRVLEASADERLALRRMGRDKLVALTRQGVLVAPPERWKARCTVLEVVAGMAVVRAETPVFVDHLQLGRFGDHWRIVNALWHVRPAAERQALEAG